MTTAGVLPWLTFESDDDTTWERIASSFDAFAQALGIERFWAARSGETHASGIGITRWSTLVAGKYPQPLAARWFGQRADHGTIAA